jgi:hypothetical protein
MKIELGLLPHGIVQPRSIELGLQEFDGFPDAIVVELYAFAHRLLAFDPFRPLEAPLGTGRTFAKQAVMLVEADAPWSGRSDARGLPGQADCSWWIGRRRRSDRF